MTKLRNLIARYPLTSFFLLSYLLSWWSLPLFRGLLPHGVALAAVIVILLSTGKSGIREFWGRLINFRAGWFLFFVAPMIIVCFRLFEVVSNLLTGATFVGIAHPPFVAIAIELLLLGGLWEEPGWSGYALPALQKRFARYKYGILIATFTLGVLRSVWHLPLFIVGAIPWYDAFWFNPIVFQPIISWLYNKSGGSVPVVTFFHYMSNLLFAVSLSFTGADKTLYTILYMSFGGLATLALLWKTRCRLGLPINSKEE